MALQKRERETPAVSEAAEICSIVVSLCTLLTQLLQMRKATTPLLTTQTVTIDNIMVTRRTYQETIAALNSLHSNQAVIKQSRKGRAVTLFSVECCGVTDDKV